MRRANSMTLGMMFPVNREKPSRSAWLMACLSRARFAARRTRRSRHGDPAFHCSGKSSHQAVLVGLEHQLDAGGQAHEPVGPKSHWGLLETLLADLVDVLLRHDPRGARRRAGVEHEEI